MVELLSPAGSWNCLRAAVKGGCDSVYFGLTELNMRTLKGGFELNELSEIAKFCHKNKVKCYLCLNSIVFDGEIGNIEEIVSEAKKAGIDAVICWDLGVLEICKKYKIGVHLSTQASCSNKKSLEVYKKLGFSRIIPCRELNLEQVKNLTGNGVEVEVFVHGALCYAISGRCFFSQEIYNSSANRGKCIHPCRRRYKLTDIETLKEIEVENDYFMSAKDLCALPFLDRIIDAGVSALKIEGRNKGAEYVHEITSVYREAIDAISDGKFEMVKEKLLENAGKVYNRGFSSGFYLGLPTSDDITNSYGSKALEKKIQVGRVENYFVKKKVIAVHLTDSDLMVGDEIIISGKTTFIRMKVESLEVNEKKVSIVLKGGSVGISIGERARKGDYVYKIMKS